jgi:hypothetical protein
MYDLAMFEKVVGPTCTLAEMQAYTPRGQDYYDRWTDKIEEHWAAWGDGSADPGGRGVNVDQYDRGIQYYGWWKMSGYTNDTWRDRARATAATYADQILNGYAPLFEGAYPLIYLQEMKQLVAHYADTGDATSLEVLGNVGDFMAYSPGYLTQIPQGYGQGADVPPNTYPYASGYNELRPWVRAFEAMICCHIANAPSDGAPGGYPGGIDWLAKAEWALERILACQYPDGFWRARDTMRDAIPADPYTAQNYPWYVRPFYNGLVCNVLILYYQSIDADARILTALRNNVDAMFGGTARTPSLVCDLFLPGPDANGVTNSLKYLDAETYDEHPTNTPGAEYVPNIGSPDINGLYLNVPAWVYGRTGITTYKDYAGALLDGPAEFAYLETTGASNYGKRFNESFSFSYRAFQDLIHPDFVRTLRLRGV